MIGVCDGSGEGDGVGEGDGDGEPPVGPVQMMVPRDLPTGVPHRPWPFGLMTGPVGALAVPLSDGPVEFAPRTLPVMDGAVRVVPDKCVAPPRAELLPSPETLVEGLPCASLPAAVAAAVPAPGAVVARAAVPDG